MGFDCWFVVAISGNIIYSWGGHFSLYPILSLIDPPWPKSVSRNCLLMETQEQRLSHPLLKYSQPPEISKPDGIWHGATLLGSCHHMSYGLHFQKRKAVSFIQQPHTYNFRDLSGCSVSGDFARDRGNVWPCHACYSLTSLPSTTFPESSSLGGVLTDLGEAGLWHPESHRLWHTRPLSGPGETFLRMWPFSPPEGGTCGLARCWPTVTAKAPL